MRSLPLLAGTGLEVFGCGYVIVVANGSDFDSRCAGGRGPPAPLAPRLAWGVVGSTRGLRAGDVVFFFLVFELVSSAVSCTINKRVYRDFGM